MNSTQVLMMGPSLSSPGGMTAVVQTLFDAGLAEKQNVRYVSTYEGSGLGRQLRVTGTAIVAMLGMLLRRNVRILHVHSASRGSFWRKSLFSSLARLFRVPYIFHIHSGEFPAFYQNECGRLSRWWIRHTLQEAATVICLTPGWRRAILSIAPKANVAALRNPVQVPDSLADGSATVTTVLFLGRLRQKKGIFDLLDAIPAVLAACPQLRFVLAGDEGEKEVLHRAKELGIDHAIELPGWVDGTRKHRLQTQSDVFVLPSYFEGLPMGILEAMAMGITVISTNVGGIPELVESGQDGLLVPPGDSKVLASAIIEVCTNPGYRQSMRFAAYGKVKQQYRPDVVLQGLYDIYEQCSAR